jgi:hypothetical protein
VLENASLSSQHVITKWKVVNPCPEPAPTVLPVVVATNGELATVHLTEAVGPSLVFELVIDADGRKI